MAKMNSKPTFAVCVDSAGCDDLSPGMLYRVLTDEKGEGLKHLRIIDDSGEDYLYPASRFVIVEVAPAEEHKLSAVAPTHTT